jgi:hypothetical protein
MQVHGALPIRMNNNNSRMAANPNFARILQVCAEKIQPLVQMNRSGW